VKNGEKVQASMEVAPCPQLEPPVDHLELLLAERVYPLEIENQGTAINSLIDDIFKKTTAWNDAAIKNLQ